MTYQAIARAYRPMGFTELKGQEHVTRTLQNALRLERLHHAFLFTGARGVGKTSAARILARALECETGPTPDPCNECAQCTAVLAGNHSDVVEIDGASNNSVEDVRGIRERVGYAPQMGRYTIYIIDEVHMLTGAAFNALLKTLEEPPPHVVFIFATTDPQKIPETIVSRTQRFDFRLLPQNVLVEALSAIVDKEKATLPEASIHLIARESGGSMRDAQSLLDQVLCFADQKPDEKTVAQILGFVDRELLFRTARALCLGEPGEALEAFFEVQNYGAPPAHFCRELLEVLRHVTVASAVADPDRLLGLPPEETERVKALAAEADTATLSRRFDLLADAYEGIARSDYPVLRMEMALMKTARIKPLVPVDHLVDRLIKLEQRALKHGVSADRAPRSRPAAGGDEDDDEPRPEPPARKRRPAVANDAAPAKPLSEPASATSRAATASPADQAPPEPRNDPASPESSSAAASPVEPEPAHPPSEPAAAHEPPAEFDEYPDHGDDFGYDEEPGEEPATTADFVQGGAPAADAEGWRDFVAGLQNGVVRGALAQVTFEGATDRELMLGAEGFTADKVTGFLDGALSERISQTFAGRTVKLVTPSGRSESLSQTKKKARKKAVDESRERMKEHPAVRRILELFPGAQLQQVRSELEEQP